MRAARGRLALALAATLVAACGSSGSPKPATVVATQPAPPARTVTLPPASTTPELRAPRPALHFDATPLPAAIRARVDGSSWHEGCPVALDDLRYIRMNHWGFDGNVHHGSMIVNATAVADVRAAFGELFDVRFPVRRMHLVDDYRAEDYSSIEHDNTSSFNCRQATGSTRWSEHAYGRAIDINPIENPYIYADGTTTHPASRGYLDRSRKGRGLAVEGGRLVAAFDAVGWGWGGRWSPAADTQHFSANGR